MSTTVQNPMKNSMSWRDLFLLLAYESKWAIESIELDTSLKPIEVLEQGISSVKELTDWIKSNDIPKELEDKVRDSMINIVKSCIAQKRANSNGPS